MTCPGPYVDPVKSWSSRGGFCVSGMCLTTLTYTPLQETGPSSVLSDTLPQDTLEEMKI